MADIKEPEITWLDTNRRDPATGEKVRVPHLGDVARQLFARLGYANVNQLADGLGLRQSVVQQWYGKKQTSPNLKNLSIALGNLNTDVFQFFQDHPVVSNPNLPQSRLLVDRLAGLLGKKEYVERLLLVFQDLASRGLLESHIDQLFADLDLDPQGPIRAIRKRTPAVRNKKR